MKPNFFINCTSIEDVKQLYKKLAMLHHPDKGGDTLTMQQINAEYQQILKDKSFSFDNEEQEKDFIIYPEVISRLIVLDQVLIELIGSWIWVSGNTYKHRETLKKAGLFFAPEKRFSGASFNLLLLPGALPFRGCCLWPEVIRPQVFPVDAWDGKNVVYKYHFC